MTLHERVDVGRRPAVDAPEGVRGDVDGVADLLLRAGVGVAHEVERRVRPRGHAGPAAAEDGVRRLGGDGGLLRLAGDDERHRLDGAEVLADAVAGHEGRVARRREDVRLADVDLRAARGRACRGADAPSCVKYVAYFALGPGVGVDDEVCRSPEPKTDFTPAHELVTW